MVFFNYSTMQMAAKVVYYGPGLCGKTTNLHHIYQQTAADSRGEMVSLETETDRTLFFDLLPIDVGNVGGFKTRVQLYTVPGQVFYNTTRKLVLKGVDGVVFVADSQRPMLDANIESVKNLEENLAESGLDFETIPIVLQFNKRDLKDICSVDEMNRALNLRGWPFFEASALRGDGVFETLRGISRLTLASVRKRLAEGSAAPAAPARAVSGPVAAAAAPAATRPIAAARPAMPAAPAMPAVPAPPPEPAPRVAAPLAPSPAPVPAGVGGIGPPREGTFPGSARRPPAPAARPRRSTSCRRSKTSADRRSSLRGRSLTEFARSAVPCS